MRAVDGVDLDIRRGEVFCLVGESGCGKTSTGKAILKLVEATEGDILLEMPDEEAGQYEDVRRRLDEPEARRSLEALRQKYSITWRQDFPWTRTQLATTLGTYLAAASLALFGLSLALGFLAVPFADPVQTVLFCVGIGLALSLVATVPPIRLWRRSRVIVALLALAVILIGPIPATYFHQIAIGSPAPLNAGAALVSPWRDLVAMITGIAAGIATAGLVSTFVLDRRKRTEGAGGIRMRSIRKRLQLIFQDPYESLNPKQSVYEIVSEPLAVNRMSKNPEETSAVVAEALADVGLRPPEEFLFRFPHELSGGQRQRVSIAAALVLQPDFIVADEPVSMLDVSIRTEILQLMMDLRASRGITFLFITHDLSLAWVLADRIAVMYLGKVVESGTTEQVIGRPMHPYTKALVSVVPSPDPRHKVERIILRGERPDPVDIPPGCRFHPRCPVAFERCGWTSSEVADQLRSFMASGVLKGATTIDDSRAGIVRLLPKDVGLAALAQELDAIVSTHRETLLPLKGIESVRIADGFVELPLRDSTEPPLVEIEPGKSVACHLVVPSETIPASVTA